MFIEIAPAIKAAVLCSALSSTPAMNDFACIDSRVHAIRWAGSILLNCGDSAVSALQPILYNESPAPSDGSEEAADSRLYHNRRCDFAYFFIMRILARQPKFAIEAGDRDIHIAELRTELLAARGER